MVRLNSRMPRKQIPANVIGPQLRKTRVLLGLTQEELAARCQLAGLDISRSTLGQIEARLRFVCDTEMAILAPLLGIAMEELYPDAIKKRLIAKKLRWTVQKRIGKKAKARSR
jgi:transcriptional regulator with XRE-family HTH domain